MAEVSVTTALNITRDGMSVACSTVKTFDMEDPYMINNRQLIGTSYEALVLGDITNLGILDLKNQDTTNFVSVAIDVSGTKYPFAIMLPGQSVSIPAVPSTIYYAKADTAACGVKVTAGSAAPV